MRIESELLGELEEDLVYIPWSHRGQRRVQLRCHNVILWIASRFPCRTSGIETNVDVLQDAESERTEIYCVQRFLPSVSEIETPELAN